MESIYTELALYGSKNECARTDTVFLPISEVCDGKVSLCNPKNINTTLVSRTLFKCTIVIFKMLGPQ